MPQRILSEGEFTAIKDTLLKSAPNDLSEEEFTRWIGPRLDGAIAEAEQSSTPVSGGALRRFALNAGAMLNPVTAAKGVYQAVRHPVDTVGAIYDAQAGQFDKAVAAGREGRVSEMFGHGAASLIPLIGPAAAEAGEQIGSGDVAGGLGTGAGLLAPVVGARPVMRGARAVVSPSRRATAAAALEAGAAERVADVMSPKVGRQKVRFGVKAADAAPALAKDLAKDGAPFTREGFHADIGQKHQAAKAALDEAADARLSSQTFETQPLIDALVEKRRTLTAETVEASRPQPKTGIARSGEGTITPTKAAVPIGADVVPGPNAPRVAVLDKAIAELQQLGPVTRYEPIRRIRQAYDGPAETIYSPAVTQDYLTARGGKLGAADVTGVLRENLAKWDPATAEANASYSLYRSADDVMQATAEVERTRPRVGRQIMARLTGVMLGGQQGGLPGAAVGYLGAPIVDAALSSGFTTQLKTARLMQQLADAIRGGNVSQVNSLTTQLQRELAAGRRIATRTAPVQAGRVTEAVAATRTAGSQDDEPATSAQR